MNPIRSLILAVKRSRRIKALAITVGIIAGSAGAVVATQAPASANFNCGGASIVFDTRHIGGGQWIADWTCGTGSPGHAIPAGVTIQKVQLWQVAGAILVSLKCQANATSAYAACNTFVSGGVNLRAAAVGTNGITYLSATKTT